MRRQWKLKGDIFQAAYWNPHIHISRMVIFARHLWKFKGDISTQWIKLFTSIHISRMLNFLCVLIESPILAKEILKNNSSFVLNFNKSTFLARSIFLSSLKVQRRNISLNQLDKLHTVKPHFQEETFLPVINESSNEI